MEKRLKSVRRRSQGDYTMAFKLHVISEVEKGEKTYKQAQKQYGIQGRSTVLVWLRKHGNLDWSKPISKKCTYMSKQKETPSKEIKRLKRELDDEKLKSLVLNTMIDTSDKFYGTSIRKKYLSKQSDNSKDSKE
jgi:transposase